MEERWVIMTLAWSTKEQAADIKGCITNVYPEFKHHVYGIDRDTESGEILTLISNNLDQNIIRENFNEWFSTEEDLQEKFNLDFDGDCIAVLDVIDTEPSEKEPVHIPIAIVFKSPRTYHTMIGELTDTFPDELKTKEGKPLYVYGIGRVLDCIKTLYVSQSTTHISCFNEYFVSPNNILDFIELESETIMLAVPIEEFYWLSNWKDAPYFETWHPEGIYYNTNVKYLPMQENIFDRKKFTEIFDKFIRKDEEVFEAFENAVNHAETVGDFKLWMEEEEVYILHVPSGTLLGWYKLYHTGRANFCNKYLCEKDIRDFFLLLRNQLLKEADVPEIDHLPKVTVKEIDKSTYNPGPDIASLYPNKMIKVMMNSTYGLHPLPTEQKETVCSCCGKFTTTYTRVPSTTNGCVCDKCLEDLINNIEIQY